MALAQIWSVGSLCNGPCGFPSMAIFSLSWWTWQTFQSHRFLFCKAIDQSDKNTWARETRDRKLRKPMLVTTSNNITAIAPTCTSLTCANIRTRAANVVRSPLHLHNTTLTKEDKPVSTTKDRKTNETEQEQGRSEHNTTQYELDSTNDKPLYTRGH